MVRWLRYGTSQFLINGFRYGFKIPFYGDRQFRKHKNLQSALENVPILKPKNQIETNAGKVAGPFCKTRFTTLQISPLGPVPKKTPGDYMIIQHLSYPAGKSINDEIPKDFRPVQYQNIDHAVALVKKLGRNCLLSKCDTLNAYKIIPISPVDFKFQGMSIDGLYYYDKTLT